MKKCKLLLLGCGLVLGVVATASAHSGWDLFLPEVPDPAAMTMDGDESDWGWYDTDLGFIYDRGDFYAEQGDVELADWNGLWYLAYSRPPENRLYFFARVQDDLLRREQTDLNQMWRDDFLQLNLDNDHSGGPGRGEDLDQARNHQRYHIRILPGDDGVVAYNGQIEFLGDDGLSWSQDVDLEGNVTGHWDIAWTVDPPDAAHGTENVEYTIEARLDTWDDHNLTEAESVRHVYAPGQVVGMFPRMHDGDEDPMERQYFLRDRITGENHPSGPSVDADKMPDFTLLEADGMTAVESTSWARIKHHMNNQLR
jgi:hypothetical protein